MGAYKCRIIGLLLSNLLATSAIAEMSSVRVSIVIYDGAHVGLKTVGQAERVAATILRTAAIQSRWESGEAQEVGNLGMDFTAYGRQQCEADPVSTILRVQILPHVPMGLPPNALGFALPCARSGVQVTIYAERVERVSQNGGPTFARVLGYAIAHELGHVLLHSDAHEPEGLMKARWSKSDWQRAAVSVISFSAEDARQIAALTTPGCR